MNDGDLWRDRNKVFVAGLPAHVDDAALYAKFKTFGEMHQSKVVFDNKTGRSKGFGFVTFCEYVHALEAVDNLNQSKWDGRTLNVRFLQPKTGAGTSSNGNSTTATAAVVRPTKVIGPRPDGCTTLYVGNLAYDITEEVLRKVFEKCGTVKAIRFAEHIQTGEFRGFGYVQFYDEAPCEQAVKLDGMVVMGRPMNIDYGSRDEESAKARDDLTKKLKKGICNKFQSGQCDRGDACKFAHVRNGEDAEELVQPADRPVGAASYMEMAAAALATPTASVPMNPDAPVCINFQKGKCKRGDACKFQHLGVDATAAAAGPIPVIKASTPVIVAPPTIRATPVRVPQASDVDTAQQTALPQGDEETSADADAPVCQNFQKNKCKRGAACRFRHVAAAPTASSTGAYVAPARVERPAAIVAEVALCQNFRRGRCLRGASCRFAHTERLLEAAAAVDVVEEVSYYQKRFQSICYNWQKSGACARGANCPFQHEGGPSPAVTAAASVNDTEAPIVDDAAVEDDDESAEVSATKKKSKKEKKAKKEKSKKREADASDNDDDDASERKRLKKAKKKAKRQEAA